MQHLINGIQNEFDISINYFRLNHPYILINLFIIGIPLIILIIVFACVSIIMYPISLILGWI